MTRRAHRPLIFVLVFLLMTWGTCPCVFAKMLGVGESDAQEAVEARPTAPC